MSTATNHERGLEAYDRGDFAAAERAFEASLSAGEDPVKGWTNLAAALRAQGKFGAAAGCAARAVNLDPENAEGWAVLGSARLDQGRVREAAASMRCAVALDPDEAGYQRSLGLAEQRSGNPEAALAAFEAGCALAPGDAHFRFLCATALLQLERYADAWPLYEARFGTGGLTRRGFDAKPHWDGSELGRRRLLIHAEQGLGDSLQFARFIAPAMARAAGEVVIEAHPPLVRLFREQFPEAHVFSYAEPPPACDVRVALTSLPGVIKGGPETGVRPDGGYLGQPRQVTGNTRPRVGLVWRGNTKHWNRSCPLPVFMQILEIAGVDFVSLQRGGAEELEAAGAMSLVEDGAGGDFQDDLHTCRALDLIISIDTSTCHFAGALGMPVWTLLTHFTDWRFPPTGATSRWYPSMRLFRMRRSDDWNGVIDEVCTSLSALVSGWGRKS